MTVVTRFAPSPTGFLHIGGARTALFNWLFAKHHGGKFCLRIEDTDRARSTPEAVQAILDSLLWLELHWDDEPIFQFARAARHAKVAQQLLTAGKAYYCYCTPEELENMRHQALAHGLPPRYDGRWRERNLSEAPKGIKPVIRFKAPQTGETTIEDLVQGPVTIANNQLDDMILLRADGTPTYMLSVVVDDHDMGITHIIRGDDHLTNAFRQYHLYVACGWDAPQFAHIPLIHGADGAKLSKRHGAIGTENYRDLGYLPQAMRNYLLRLGWSHGEEEIIHLDKAIHWFNLDAVGRSAARFDLARLNYLNAHYLRQVKDEELVALVIPFLHPLIALSSGQKQRLLAGMPGLKQRATTLVDLAQNARFYLMSPDLSTLEADKFTSILTIQNATYIKSVLSAFEKLENFSPTTVEQTLRQVAEQQETKLGNLASPLRVALTGRTISPSLFEVITVLEKTETLDRLQKFIDLVDERSGAS